VRAAVDVMGGDNAPAAVLQGCWDAAPLLGVEDSILLVGDQAISQAALDSSPLSPEQKRKYRIVHTTQVVHMDDPPVEAIRGKPDSSLSVMCKLAAKGEADVVISAGNTGACVAAAQLRMRTLPGISRPGIAVVVPTFHGPVVLCDVGANVAPKPMHLLQYAIMAGAYASAVCGVKKPRIGLLSIGEEDAKGNAIVKETRKLMRDEPLINFVGNVEGRDLTKGVVDVIITDGFVGNVVLKLMEGLTEGLFKQLAAELEATAPAAMEQFNPAMRKIYAGHDWREYGGAPLLGVGGYCLICHGRSDAKAIRNAIRVGKQLVESGVNEKIVETVEKSVSATEE
jgi:glycerol-3-phosphate acyltransferase PlsX